MYQANSRFGHLMKQACILSHRRYPQQVYTNHGISLCLFVTPVPIYLCLSVSASLSSLSPSLSPVSLANKIYTYIYVVFSLVVDAKGNQVACFGSTHACKIKCIFLFRRSECFLEISPLMWSARRSICPNYRYVFATQRQQRDEIPSFRCLVSSISQLTMAPCRPPYPVLILIHGTQKHCHKPLSLID